MHLFAKNPKDSLNIHRDSDASTTRPVKPLHGDVYHRMCLLGVSSRPPSWRSVTSKGSFTPTSWSAGSWRDGKTFPQTLTSSHTSTTSCTRDCCTKTRWSVWPSDETIMSSKVCKKITHSDQAGICLCKCSLASAAIVIYYLYFFPQYFVKKIHPFRV